MSAVLNVDDNEHVRYARTCLLNRAGLQVIEAASGEEALAFIAKSPPAVILLDVHLPGMSGLDVCRSIKSQAATECIQVVQISAQSITAELQAAALEAGADYYLTDPVPAGVLAATVKAALRHWQALNARRAAEAALQRREAELAAVFDTISTAICITKPEGDVVNVNPAFLALHGFSGKDDMMRRAAQWGSLFETTYPNGAPLPFEQWPIERVKRGEPVRDYEVHVRVRETGERWAGLFNGRHIRGSDGETEAFVISISDITDVHTTHEELLKANARFRTLADNMSQLAWMADRNGWIFWYNRRWYEYTGTMLEDMQGWGWTKVHHPDHVDRVVQRIKQSWETGEVWQDTFPLRGKSGEWRWFLSRALPIRNDAGEIETWFGTNTDITELRETQEELRRRTADLAQSNEELGRLAYAASHDLKEPLRMVSSFSELLVRRNHGKLDADSLRFTRFIQSGVSRMRALIDDLLEYARASDPASERTTVADANVSVGVALENLSASISESGASVTFDSLPLVYANGSRLTSVFQNLISNAIKYRRDVVPEVHVSATVQGAECTFSVRDNGIGFDMSQADEVFRLFGRLHPRQYDGTGMGLPICKRIVERYGGRLWAESQPGVGSTFYFTVPAADRRGYRRDVCETQSSLG